MADECRRKKNEEINSK